MLRNAIRPILMSAIVVLSVWAASGGAVAGETFKYEYNMPSSFVIKGIFGFGILTCKDAPPLADVIKNGPCIDYTGHEAQDFRMTPVDLTFTPSMTLAVDVDGDGCISGSCGTDDYRLNGCGPLSGVLPFVESGVTPIIQVYIRAIDVDLTTGFVCAGSNGHLVLEYD